MFATAVVPSVGSSETYSRQNGVMSRPVVTAMLGSGSDLHAETLPISVEERFVVSVRNLNEPSRLVVHKSQVRSLRDWYKLFEKDVFGATLGTNTAASFPVLYPSKRFYSTRFHTARHVPMEVQVTPVLLRDGVVRGDVVIMHIVPPELPLDDMSRMRDPAYPADIMNIMFCMRLLQAGATGFRGLNALTTAADQALAIGGGSGSSEIVNGLPEYWDFAFETQVNKEKACGDNSIPQILSRLWFLRSTVNQDVHYSVVQLNEAAYIGVLQNVSGFNVFFQVNCRMPVDTLLSFLPDISFRVPRRARGGIPGQSPRMRARERTLKQQIASYSAMRDRIVTYFNNADNETPRVGLVGPKEKDLWKLVVAHADARLNVAAVALKDVVDEKALNDVGHLARKLLPLVSGEGKRPDRLSSGMLARNRASALNAKYYLLRELLHGFNNDDILALVEVLAGGDLSGVGRDVRFDDFAAALPTDLTREIVEGLGSVMVPDVFPDKIEFALYMMLFPAVMGTRDADDLLGGVEEFYEDEVDFIATEVIPDSQGDDLLAAILEGDGAKIYRSELIAWILSRGPTWLDDKVRQSDRDFSFGLVQAIIDRDLIMDGQ
eukprot:3935538-Rhodomonas_salina.1